MIPEAALWAILFLPLASFVLISLVIRPFFNRRSELSGFLTILAIAASFALSLWALQSAVGREGVLGYGPHRWLTLGDLDFQVGIMLDSLTAIMLVVVTGVSLLIQVYSQGYMLGDPGYSRYFAFMSLFTASMTGLVLASNILQLYVFWELVGLCSYLLIGFWYHRPAAAEAAKKAFLVTRIGDFGFLLAILYLFFHRADFAAQGLDPFVITNIHQMAGLVQAGTVVAFGGLGLTWLAVGIFAGAAGKSAQFPLHVWLPDAMEGPTPVSALIHAATMVAAGVFLVARFFPLFEASEIATNAVALVGAFTALFAATMGLVMHDIKRVLAYSTISQLGYMMAALGIGAYDLAVFHLFNHAFFKALLFLGAGSVSHATGTFDMRYMGGLRRVMPITYTTMVIGGLSLAGLFPLAGFWSKDEVVAHALGGGSAVDGIVFVLLMVGIFVTAFYMFRLIFLTFHGQFRGGMEAEVREQPGVAVHGEPRVHLAESLPVMTVPLMLLAVPSVLSGYLVNPLGLGSFLAVPGRWFQGFLEVSASAPVYPLVLPFDVGLAVWSTLLALGGIALAGVMYLAQPRALEGLRGPLRLAYTGLTNKYYMDSLYKRILVSRLFYRGLCAATDWFDRTLVDGTVDTVGWFGRNLGRGVARLQTGQVQAYAVGIFLGILVILAAYLIWG